MTWKLALLVLASATMLALTLSPAEFPLLLSCLSHCHLNLVGEPSLGTASCWTMLDQSNNSGKPAGIRRAQ
jgi:hypothetical protein